MTRPLLICLAGSGGGHLRQLLDLEPVWRNHDRYFVTEDTALGRSLGETELVDLVEHYAFGQTRHGRPDRMVAAGLRNLAAARRSVRRRNPDVVITTGAGAVFLPAVLAKLNGAKLIVIESFARFERPSLFGRMIRRFADVFIVQSAALASRYPGALVFDPFRRLDGERPDKEPLIFATVGATLAFPRLSEGVAAAKREGRLSERVLLQTGADADASGDTIDGLERVETLSWNRIRDTLRRADIVVTHGGTGSLITALREGCRVIAVPRRHDLKEHYDDHQEQIVDAFVERGLIQRLNDLAALPAAVAEAKARTPVMATTEPGMLIAWLETYLSKLAAS